MHWILENNFASPCLTFVAIIRTLAVVFKLKSWDLGVSNTNSAINKPVYEQLGC